MQIKNKSDKLSSAALLAPYGFLFVLFVVVPVVCAVILSFTYFNTIQRPEFVGINMLASGRYQWIISRTTAVLLPLAITGICLVLMACSKKVLYPWLVSVFSLALPLVLWLTNLFPA